MNPGYRHGGQHVSEHLHKRLHGMIEEVDKVTIDETIAFTKRLGGSLGRGGFPSRLLYARIRWRMANNAAVWIGYCEQEVTLSDSEGVR